MAVKTTSYQGQPYTDRKLSTRSRTSADHFSSPVFHQQHLFLTVPNEHFVFGGKNKHNQIAKIICCRLEPLNIELPFYYINGACVTVDNDQRPDKQVYLCFSVDELNTEGPESKKCRVAASPHDETWTEIDDSYAKHQHIRISTNNGK